MNAEKKKVLFVTRDKKPGMIAVKIARKLEEKGETVAVIAEGLSIGEWDASELGLSGGFQKGPVDIKEPWGISASTILADVRPDVVVCGLSSPIRAEAWFASATRQQSTIFRGIPLVCLDDNWGAVYRCQTPADLVFTIDALGKRLVEQSLLYDRRDYKVEIIGDLSATAATEPIPQATIDAFNAAKGDADFAFVLCSQKWTESDDIIRIGLESCAMSLEQGAKLVVIPRFHPGASDEDKVKWRDKVGLLIREYPDAVQTIDGHNTDHLATLADGTFAATGSALRAAAYAGKFPICVWTPRLGEKLKAESGMEHHSLAVADAALELFASEEIVACIENYGDNVRFVQKELLTPISFDAEKAADAILALVK